MNGTIKFGQAARLLACLALLIAIQPASAQPPAAPMTFTLGQGAAPPGLSKLASTSDQPIWASGTILKGTAERFRAFIAANKITKARVYLDSRRGSVVEGMALGRAIRKLHLNTDVGAETDTDTKIASGCMGACIYAYAGGIGRFLDSTSGALGVHRFYGKSDRAKTADIQALSGIIVEYLIAVGVDPQVFSLSSLVGHRDVAVLTLDDAEKFKLANQGATPTTAEFRFAQQHSGLMLQQNRYDLTLRAFFVCLNAHLVMAASILDTPERVSEERKTMTGSYVEFDHVPLLQQSDIEGLSAKGDGFMVTRRLPPDIAARLLKADQLGLWIAKSGAARWGGPMDLRPVRNQLSDFIQDCK
jgi:hypothetical protein